MKRSAFAGYGSPVLSIFRLLASRPNCRPDVTSPPISIRRHARGGSPAAEREKALAEDALGDKGRPRATR